MQSAALMQRASCARLAGKPSPRLAGVQPAGSRRTLVCRAQKGQQLRQQLAAAGAAAALSLATLSGVAIASEFDIIGSETPKAYYYDDAGVLSKATRGEISARLKGLEYETGYHLEVVTVRKLEFETDSFAFAEKALENWYGDKSDKKGILLVVTAGKEGALVGGQSFIEAIGNDLIDDITTTNIPIFTEEEKYNQTVLSSIERVAAKLKGQEVPAGPQRADDERKRTYKTKEETENSKGVTSTVVLSLLLIAVVVPMLQYYGYVAKD